MHGDILLLQFRTLVRFGRKKDLAREISSLVKKYELGDVVVVGSLPFESKLDL
jgi:hypothetical protein